MGFLKTVRKSSSLLSKSERGIKKQKSHLSKDEVIDERVQHKTAYFHDQRSNQKRKRKHKMKYTGAISSQPEESGNVRVYTFSLSTKNNQIDEDSFTVSTMSERSASSTDVESESQSLLPCNHEIEGINLHQIQRSPSTESVLSSPSLSDHSVSYDIDLRDDIAEEFTSSSGNRDIPDSEPPKWKQSSFPLLPPPRQYVADGNVCNSVNVSLLIDIPHTPIDIPHNPLSSEYPDHFDAKNKLLSTRDVRRYASEGSRDYVHVFRQPLMPLGEGISLYESGDDADDDCSEQSSSEIHLVSRRGSLNSSDDENDLRQRWEYGLAMMAKMGIDAVVVNQGVTLKVEDQINTLSPADYAFDEDHIGEI